MPQEANSTNPSVSDFTVDYLTPKGNVIKLTVPEFPNDPLMRALLADMDDRPEWARDYLDSIYTEHRERDNRRRTDRSGDIGEEGMAYFAEPTTSFEDKIISQHAIVELCRDLTPLQRDYIELHVDYGYKFTQIAQKETEEGRATSADGVRKSVRRGFAQLKKKLLADPSGFDLPRALQVQGADKRTTAQAN